MAIDMDAYTRATRTIPQTIVIKQQWLSKIMRVATILLLVVVVAMTASVMVLLTTTMKHQYQQRRKHHSMAHDKQVSARHPSQPSSSTDRRSLLIVSSRSCIPQHVYTALQSRTLQLHYQHESTSLALLQGIYSTFLNIQWQFYSKNSKYLPNMSNCCTYRLVDTIRHKRCNGCIIYEWCWSSGIQDIFDMNRVYF